MERNRYSARHMKKTARPHGCTEPVPVLPSGDLGEASFAPPTSRPRALVSPLPVGVSGAISDPDLTSGTGHTSAGGSSSQHAQLSAQLSPDSLRLRLAQSSSAQTHPSSAWLSSAQLRLSSGCGPAPSTGWCVTENERGSPEPPPSTPLGEGKG